MESKLILQQKILTNPYPKPLTIRSLDFTELDGVTVLSNYSQPLGFVFPIGLKIKEDEYEDKQGNPIISFMLVDKDY